MKNKLLFAGLVASAALVGCTNDEFIEQTSNGGVAKGETTLVFDGFGGDADTKMAYDGKGFMWQEDDQIGVRRVLGDIVISNTMFKVTGTSNDKAGDPSQWTGTQGKYAFFESNDETLHEADYIVTFPYDKSSVQDGKVIGRLPVAQVANENDGTEQKDNKYAGNYGFMMSTATHMNGGQNTEFFTLYPVFSRLTVNITENTTLKDVKVQSIILESQDGSAIFPTTLEVGADVQMAADGFLDAKYMTPGTEKVNQIVLTTVERKNGLSSNPNTPDTWYMTLVPGKYDKFQIRVNTNQGTFVKKYDTEAEFKSGYNVTTNIAIDKLVPYTEYVVASEIDWVQALQNIHNYLNNPTIGNTSTIRVMGNVEIDATKFRAAAMNTVHTINVVGNGSITIDGNLDQKNTPDESYTLGIMNFNVPVTVDGNFKEVAEGDQLTFAELNVKGDFYPTNEKNYTSIVVNKGTVTGKTTYRTAAKNAALTMNKVTFNGLVEVTAMKADGNNADAKTTKVNFNDCTFAGGLRVDDRYEGVVAVTINGGQIANQNGTAAFTVGYSTTDPGAHSSTVYVKGNVVADNLTMGGAIVAGKVATLDILGSLTVNGTLEAEIAGDYSKILVEKDATLTLGKNANFEIKNDGNIQIEGTLVNNGLLTVPANVVLNDIDRNNKNRGVITNNGVLFAPANKWYENQNIDVNHAGEYEYVLSGVTNANLPQAIATVEDENRADITGVELTGTSYNFTEKADYSAYDLYVTGDATLVAPSCKFGNLTVRAVTVTLDNDKTSTTEFGDVVIESGMLSIDNTRNAASTLKCTDMTLFSGTTIEHANQLDCANEAWSDGNTGTIIWE